MPSTRSTSGRARTSALACVAVVASSLALPLVPSTSAAAEETTSSVHLTDLGSLRGQYNEGYLSAINNKGVATGYYFTTDDDQHPATFDAAGRHSIKAAFNGSRWVVPRSINDGGAIAGDMATPEGTTIFRYEQGGVATLDRGIPVDINERGDVLTPVDILRADGGALDLTTEGGAVRATAFNEWGNVVGGVDLDPGEGKEVHAFITRPGEAVDLRRDLLGWAGTDAYANDVNEAGVVAGLGVNESGGYEPVFWGADGGVRRPVTPFGGWVEAIDMAGTGVGVMRDLKEDDITVVERAALFPDAGQASGVYLQDLLPADSPWILDDAVDINEQGQIIGHMHTADRPWDQHGYILDLSHNAGPEITDLHAEHRDVPTYEWKALPARGTTDGNLVRLSATVTNPTAYPASVSVQFRNAAGKALEDGTTDTILMAGETIEVHAEVDTAGGAWNDDATPDLEPESYSVALSQGGTLKDSATVDFKVQPRPVILVHGYKSNAASSWGKYQPILSEGHPGLRGYAVGDQQYPGLMNTGSFSEPYRRTNTIDENAQEEARYIRALREDLDAMHVDIAAHSMGGLISRQYIHTYMPPANGWDHRPVVNRLIQLGTPNTGSTCADLMLKYMGSAAPLWPATLQLSRPYAMFVFNPEVTNLRGVRISNLVGRPYPVLCGEKEVGDAIVPDYSALWTLSDTHDTLSHHLEMTEDRDDFQKYVLPRLAGDPVTTSDTSLSRSLAESDVEEASARSGLTADSAESTAAEPSAAQAFASDTVDVAPGDTATVRLPAVADGSRLGVATVAGSPQVGLSLLDPTGAKRDGIAAGSDEAKQPFQGLEAEPVTAGRWFLKVHNNASEAAKLTYTAWVADPSLRLEVAADARESGRVAVTATLRADAQPVEGSLVARLYDIDAQELTTVDLYDDGAHDDGQAGDGEFGGLSDVVPDGDTVVAAHAVTDQGDRFESTVVKVAHVDRSPKTLTLTSQPGGTASADPQLPTYEYGAKVTVRATPKAGELAQGWVVDGAPHPAGDLELTMDRDHEVVARFGHYTIEELPAMPGGRLENTTVTGLNDRGEVLVNVTEGQVDGEYLGRRRAAIYHQGHLQVLPGLPCSSDGALGCSAEAFDIDDRGDVVGYSELDGDFERATVWREGRPQDIAPPVTDSTGSVAETIGDDGLIAGGYDRSMPYPPVFGTWSANRWRRFSAPDVANPAELNARGQGATDLVSFGPLGHVSSRRAAIYAGGKATRLEPYRNCGTTYDPEDQESRALGINDDGVVVGQFLCAQTAHVSQAMMWREGRVVRLGDGAAHDINNGGLVVGSRVQGNETVPVMWLDGKDYDLRDYLPAACPVGTPTHPCFRVGTPFEVNDAGQMVAMGELVDRGDLPGHWTSRPRAFLLSPTTADADLIVAQTAPVASIAPGQTTTRTVTVRNAGPETATGVVVDLEVPRQLTVESCTSSRGACSALPMGRRVVLDELAAGQTASVTVTSRVADGTAAGTDLTTRASAYSRAVRDPKRANNVAEVTVTALPMVADGVQWPDAVGVGSTSYPVDRWVYNHTERPLTITSVAASTGFSQTSTCPRVLDSGASCAVSVRFQPAEARGYTGVLTVTTEEVGDLSLTLAGTGKAANSTPVMPHPAPTTGTAGQPFTLRVAFTDADVADTHTAEILWSGQGPPVPADLVEEQGGSGVVVASRTFTAPRSDFAIILLHDSAGNSTFARAGFTITDKPANTAPVVAPLDDVDALVGETFTRIGAFSDAGSQAWTATVDYGDGSGPAPLSLDGQAFTLEHRYTRAGDFTVELRVTDAQGLSGSRTFTVHATKPNTAPVVSMGAPSRAIEGGAWSWVGSFTDPDDDTWTASVSFGDGTVESVDDSAMSGPGAHALALEHRWTDDGVYPVAVTVRDSAGAEVTHSALVVVDNAAPTAALVGPAPDTVAALGSPITLTGSLSDPGAGDVHSAAWTLEPLTGGPTTTVEGTVSEAAGLGTVTGSVTPASAGRYRVTLSVSDDDGAGALAAQIDGRDLTVLVVDPSASVQAHGSFAASSGSCTLVSGCGSSGGTAFELAASYPGGGLAPAGDLRVTTSGFKLRSTALTALMRSGGVVTVDGQGVVNGDVPVRFTVTLLKATPALRLQVWRLSDDRVVYDNAPSGLSGATGKVNGQVSVS